MADVPFMPIEISHREVEELRERLRAARTGTDADVVTKYIARSRYDNDNQVSYSLYIDLILEGMGMTKYVELFRENDVGVNLLVQLTEDDLKAIGIEDESDRARILESLEEFRPRKKSTNPDNYMTNSLDDKIMLRNIVNHLLALSSHAEEIKSKLSTSEASDCFITDEWTGVRAARLVIQRALTQCERISHMLYGGGASGNNMINSVLIVNEKTLPMYLERKIVRAERGRKKRRILKKKKFIVVVLVTLCIDLMARSYLKGRWF